MKNSNGKIVKCWSVEVFGVTGFAWAEKASHATTAAYHCLQDSGYGNAYKHARTRRAPQYDAVVTSDMMRKWYTEDHVKKAIKELNEWLVVSKASYSKPFSDRDWKDDFDHENGFYQNLCARCGLAFFGHKLRTICKSCVYPAPKPKGLIERILDRIAEALR